MRRNKGFKPRKARRGVKRRRRVSPGRGGYRI